MKFTPTQLKLLTNTAAQFLARLFSASLSFLLSMVLIRHFGPSFYGDFVKITALLFFNNTLVDLGINALVVRRLAKLSRQSRNRLLNQLLELRFYLAVLAVGLTSFWLFGLNPPHYSPNLKIAYLFGSLSVFGFAFYLSALANFQFHLAYLKSALANSFGGMVFFLLALFLLRFPPNLKLLLLSFSFGYLTTALVAFLFSRQVFKFNLTLPTKLSSSHHLLQASFWISLAFIFSSLANKSDVLVASLYRPASAIGQYGFAYKIFDFLIVLPSLLMNVVYPLLLRSPRTKRQITFRISFLFLILSLALAGFVYLGAPLILYLRPHLQLALRSLRILSLALPLFYLTPPLMWYLVVAHRERNLAFVYGFATLLNLGLNFLFVPNHGVIASAYLTFVTEALIFLSLLFLFLKSDRFKSH